MKCNRVKRGSTLQENVPNILYSLINTSSMMYVSMNMPFSSPTDRSDYIQLLPSTP